MGFYLRLAPGVKIRATSRGLRASVGPRAARVHFGAGGTGVSTGAGPLTYYAPLHGHARSRSSGSRTSTGRATGALRASAASAASATSATSAKAGQAQQAAAAINGILALHRENFPPATAPVAPEIEVPALAVLVATHEKSALEGIGLFHRAERTAAKEAAHQVAAAEHEARVADAAQRRQEHQRALDEWWHLLNQNEPAHVMWALTTAYEDNEAAAAPLGVDGGTASVVVQVPDPDLIPERMPGVTDAGNVSLRKMTKSQFNDLYKLMVCGYLVVTVKEGFAAAPGLTEIAAVAVRRAPMNAYGERRPEAVMAVRFTRASLDGIHWDTANAVQVVNDASSERVLVEKGAAAELQPLDVAGHPEIANALEAIDLTPDDAPADESD